MRPGALPSRPAGMPLAAVALLAGAGQVFLARPGGAALALGLLLYAGSLFFLYRLLPVPAEPPSDLPAPGPFRSMEAVLFLSILLLAVLFRYAGSAPLPNGVFADRAEVALGALRILHEGWRPGLSALDLHVPELPIYYLAAGWFRIAGASPESFARFDATLSLLGVLGFFLVFRRVGGTGAALAGFFLLAVMRWNFVFGRQIYFQTQTVLFSAAALLLLLRAFQDRSRFLAAAAGAVAALGLYSYQALKALPILFLALLLQDLLADKEGFRARRGTWAAFGAAFLLLTLPYLAHSAAQEQLGRRESEVSVMVEVRDQGSLRPLLRNVLAAAGMANRRGDDNSQSNYGAHRMLDDVTGVFFLLGLFHALRRLRERPYFLAVAGLVVFTLPALLSINGAHAGRSLGSTPFIALLGGLLLRDLWQRFKKEGRVWAVLTAGVLGAAAAAQNGVQYFHEQVRDPAHRSDFSWAESKVGRRAAGGAGTEFFLSSRFYGHPTVRYLGLDREASMHPFDPSAPPRPRDFPGAKAFEFLLDERKAGVLEYLSTLYPGGRVEAFTQPNGERPLYAFHAGPAALAQAARKGPRVERGLRAVYRRTDLPGEPILLSRWEPLVDLSFRDLPGLPAPILARWEGRLRVGQKGHYEFLVLTYEQEPVNQARLGLDRTLQTPFMACPALAADLAAGWHGLVLEYRKPEGPLATVNLLWKRPGMDRYEYIPNEAFGPVP